MYVVVFHSLLIVTMPLVGAVSAQPASQPTSRSSTPESSATVDDLRRFEEASFPRRNAHVVAPPQTTRKQRPSAENPPAELRSSDHRSGGSPGKPPLRWLGKLVLPDLPITWDEKLIRYLEFYRSHPRGRALMRLLLRRKGRYEEMITKTLSKYGLPRALTHVAMVESAYNPLLTSRVGAAGLWQFMSHSGRGYGLNRDHWVDERRNPERSTDAAARYLKKLKQQFGTWELALAAYNAGAGMIILAMQKYNTNDYWQLCRYESGLPWSTSLYVPKILATAIVAANREFFGFGDITFDPPYTYQLVSVSRSIPVTRLAKAAGVDAKTIRQLNPELRRKRTRPGKSWIRVPRGTATRFYKQLSTMKLARYRPYVVRLGDTDESIAQQHGISRGTLRSINGLRSADLRAGLVILLPAKTAPRVASKPDTSEPEPIVVALPKGCPRRITGRRRVFYRVVLGDKLDVIARHLKVSTNDLARWNALDRHGRLVSTMVLQAFVAKDLDTRSIRLLPRNRVKLMVAGSEPFLDQHERAKGRRRLTYVVRDNDTLKRISRRFGLSVGSIMRINKISRSARLRKGQKIVVYTEKKPRSVAKSKIKRRARPKGRKLAAPSVSRRRTYTVRENDNLTRIGRRFGISVAELKRINKLSSARLQVGQKLTVSQSNPKRAQKKPTARTRTKKPPAAAAN